MLKLVLSIMHELLFFLPKTGVHCTVCPSIIKHEFGCPILCFITLQNHCTTVSSLGEETGTNHRAKKVISLPSPALHLSVKHIIYLVLYTCV